MKPIKKFLGLVTAATIISFAGVGYSAENILETRLKTISKVPISVITEGRAYLNDGALVILLEKDILEKCGKPFIAYTTRGSNLKIAKAKALIEYEINDGDNEQIEITGYPNIRDGFLIRTLNVEGYELEFRVEKHDLL